MYVITGATGNIGSKAADILLAKGEKVRVIGRDAAKLRQFVDRGAEAAMGDLRDTAFLRKAFEGATAVFAMIPPNFAAIDFRAYQHEVGASIASAIADAQVGYVVNLSSQGADLPAGTGPIMGLRAQEERLNGLETNVLNLRATYFMENLFMAIPLIHEKGFAGSAVRGDQPIAMIATKDIAARVAEHLLRRDFSGKVVKDLLGQRDLTMEEAFRVLGLRIGRPELKYVQFSYDDAAKGMVAGGVTPDLARLVTEMGKALNNGLFSVNRPRTAENTTPTSIEEFADIFAQAYKAATLKHAA